MNRIDPDQEQQNILKALDENPDLQLREIHQHLVAKEDSQFVHSPEFGEKYNDERFIVKALVEILNEKKDFVTYESRSWSLTKRGRERVA